MSRSDAFDLFKLNEAIAASTGCSLFPSTVSQVFQKFALLGPEAVDPDAVRGTWTEFLRAKEVTVARE